MKKMKIEIKILDKKRKKKMVQVYFGLIGKKKIIVERQDEIKLRFQIVEFSLSFLLRDSIQR
jgi:hypothetical protein